MTAAQPALFPRLKEQHRPTHEPQDDVVRCHKCGRRTPRAKAFAEEKLLWLVYVCRRCGG